jgi:hypothetical protein
MIYIGTERKHPPGPLQRGNKKKLKRLSGKKFFKRENSEKHPSLNGDTLGKSPFEVPVPLRREARGVSAIEWRYSGKIPL